MKMKLLKQRRRTPFIIFLIFDARTVTGVLKGYDQLLNLVLDEVEEQVQGTW
jgi:small nuclear ribonucleoprotein (snRNP)-like protein